MGFVGVYRALYDYAAHAQNELALQEGDVLYILEKSTEDDWWRAKKKAGGNDEEEPEGLIPNNYVEEVQPKTNARALFDYDRQTEEELSFKEHSRLEVYDTTDPDWTLVGLHGEYGFVPANYIEIAGESADDEEQPPPMPTRPRAPQAQPQAAKPGPPAGPVNDSVAALAGIIAQQTGRSSSGRSRATASQPIYTPEASDEEPAPALPRRPASQTMSPTREQFATANDTEPPGVMGSPPYSRVQSGGDFGGSSSGYRLYNIHEIVSHMGHNRKMPTTLGINVARGKIMIAPEKSKDGAQKDWTAEKLTHYSIEGKHVFLELVQPSKSVDFHAGARDTATEIVSALGELAGAARAEGLREVIVASAGSGKKKAHMLYEHMALDNDEVTVAAGDEVVVLDDNNHEWWKVRRVKNGQEGVVPASYVEVTESAAAPAPAAAPARTNTGISMRDQNRMEEERLAREAVRNTRDIDAAALPDRNSSLGQREESKRSRRRRTDSKSNSVSSSKPDRERVRIWTDRSGAYKVEAQFLGLQDGKIKLHKTNGIQIAVAASKMSIEDLEYVERYTGASLDEDKPLADIKRRASQRSVATRQIAATIPSPTSAGAAIQPEKSKYDWFDFFLQCGVNPQICERYASAFDRDQMGEENMEEIQPTLLRTLGLKEGDILRVMKHLDSKYARDRPADSGEGATNGETSLFSGSNGVLRNNTRKGRPAPTVESTDTVDPRAFEQENLKRAQPADATPTPIASLPAPPQRSNSGFDDDAWDVKPAAPTRSMTTPAQTISQPPRQQSTITGAMSELSLLSPPLQPTPAPAPPAPQQQLTKTGADPSFFNQLAQPGPPQQQRQRPQPPMQLGQGSILPPPRPTSAPQHQTAFQPPMLRPQMTGSGPQLAPPGQSMSELQQQRFQQPLYSQPTGFNYNQPNGIPSQQTGFQTYQQLQPQQTAFQFQRPQQPSFQMQQQQSYMNGQPTGPSPFADPIRLPYQPSPQPPSGYNQSFSPPPMQPQQTGVNAYLPQPLQPQPTAFNVNGYGGAPSQMQQMQQPQPALQLPPIPQQPIAAPLIPQKTGPAPPIRFGVQPAAQPLVPQPTGRANLAKATPLNPFGFE